MRNDTNLGKTLDTMFSGYGPENLAQLYFSIETPNINTCGSYWQVFEYQLLNSFLGFAASRCGKAPEVKFNSAKPEKMPDALTRHRTGNFTLFGREMLWRMSHWKNRRFCAWLAQIQPEHIFAVMSDSGERADSIRWIAEKCHCPVTLFITDDYYHDETQSENLLRKAFFRDKQKRIRRMAVQCCDRVIGCSELASREFGELFGLPYETIYTPSRNDLLELPLKNQKNGDCIVFRYFGNLGLERWRSLKLLGETIRNINESCGEKKAFLEVYSSFTDKSITEELNIENGSAFKGFVTGKQFTDLLAGADVAVHVESFLPDMIRRTRLSISTKIADYLGSGKCILAIGPEEVASMQHISQTACVVYAPEKLRGSVEKLIDSANLREEYQQKARAFAEEKHSLEQITAQVQGLF